MSLLTFVLNLDGNTQVHFFENSANPDYITCEVVRDKQTIAAGTEAKSDFRKMADILAPAERERRAS